MAWRLAAPLVARTAWRLAGPLVARTTLRLALLLVALGGGAGSLGAQIPTASDRGVAVGVERRQYTIGPDSTATTVDQWVVPVGLTWQRGRLGLDLGTSWVRSRLSLGDSGRSVSSLTDTQIRAAYTFGRDFVVASLVANLPTGLSRAPGADFPVLGAISSSFLAFPAASHGAGFSLTGGMAVAVPAGQWNLGIAASMRWSGEYTPYVDPTGPFSYRPGLEGRVRAGVDRIVGRSRITAGLTYSSFGTDEFGTGTTTAGLYQPGDRWTVEGGVVAPVGRSGLVSVYGWHYRRVAGDSSRVSVANSERITAGGISWEVPLRSGLDLDLSIDGRTGRMGSAPGRLVGGQAGLGIALSRRLSLLPAVRYDLGSLDPVVGRLDVRGYGFSVYLRSR